jgi:cell division septal protein FtsQ
MLPVAVGHGAGALRARVGSLSPRVRRWLLAALAGLALLATLYYAWFRDSSLVAVEEVTVIGIKTDDAPRIRARLAAVARDMTVLHVDEEKLMRALPVGAAVADLRVRTDFPHGMTIEVVQSPAVAVLVAPGRRMPVAGDGTVLKGARSGNVPTIGVDAVPGSGRLGRGRARQLVAAAAAAPVALRSRIERMRYLSAKGLVAYLERGPQVILGDASSLSAKWAAAAAILADGESRGASYVDVSLPDRPVAGGVDVPQPEPEQPPAGTGAVPAQPGATPAQPGATPAQPAAPAAPAQTTPAPPGATTPQPSTTP